MERVRAAGDWPGRLAALDAALLRRLGPVALPPAEVTEAWRLTTAAHGTAACYVVTADPTAVRARAAAAGAEIVRELTTTDYGSQEFSLRDPEGNLWSFGTYAGEPRRAG